jgi:hypothetical protein
VPSVRENAAPGDGTRIGSSVDVAAHLRTQLVFAAMALVVFTGNVVCELAGWRLVSRRGPRPASGTGAIEATAFALLGLLLAFSFSGAEGRLSARRDLIVKEAETIQSVYLRLDVMPQPARDELKGYVRHYLNARIAFYDNLLDDAKAAAAQASGLEVTRQLWSRTVEAGARARDARALTFVLSALDEMLSVKVAREAALRAHMPVVILVFLAVLSFACAFVAGMNMAGAGGLSVLHVFLFASLTALATYLIVNLEFPRAGFLRIGLLDDVLIHLRATLS